MPRPAERVGPGSYTRLITNHALLFVFFVFFADALRNQCVVLQTPLVDGSPCGYGGHCYNATCQSGPWQDRFEAMYTQNLQISIPVTIVAGIIVSRDLSSQGHTPRPSSSRRFSSSCSSSSDACSEHADVAAVENPATHHGIAGSSRPYHLSTPPCANRNPNTQATPRPRRHASTVIPIAYAVKIRSRARTSTRATPRLAIRATPMDTGMGTGTIRGCGSRNRVIKGGTNRRPSIPRTTAGSTRGRTTGPITVDKRLGAGRPGVLSQMRASGEVRVGVESRLTVS